MFVVLEGPDGTGKSTQVARVAGRWRAQGRDVVETFEPGATAVGAELRAIVLDAARAVDPVTEALVMAADRALHVAEIVGPALARGSDVVSDRYVPSSLAYQGIVRGLGVVDVEALNRFATGGIEPDVVVVLDVSTADARSRSLGTDRLESEGAEFHERVRRAYLDLAVERGWTVVDADADIETVTDRIMDVLA